MVMPVARRPREIREFPFVLGAVGAVMPGREVQPDSKCQGARRLPAQQDDDDDQALERDAHASTVSDAPRMVNETDAGGRRYASRSRVPQPLLPDPGNAGILPASKPEEPACWS